jgi:hypothetical protein
MRRCRRGTAVSQPACLHQRLSHSRSAAKRDTDFWVWLPSIYVDERAERRRQRRRLGDKRVQGRTPVWACACAGRERRAVPGVTRARRARSFSTQPHRQSPTMAPTQAGVWPRWAISTGPHAHYPWWSTPARGLPRRTPIPLSDTALNAHGEGRLLLAHW